MTNSKANEITQHLPLIFDNEASSILQDLIGSPALMSMLMFSTESQVNAAKKYIISVFEECYRDGHLRVIGAANDDTLYGYALVFGHPTSPILYCHKIFVYEPYRGHSIGSQLLNGILSLPRKVGLLCSSELVSFYESAGMKFKGNYITPDTEGFKLTHNMYAGLCVMNNDDNNETEGLPIFILNDNDIKNIISAIANS
ncbi:GNAT family N-acetyltransferase [Morganella morganii subsp. sibonii]